MFYFKSSKMRKSDTLALKTTKQSHIKPCYKLIMAFTHKLIFQVS